jgi:YHS domain-containing protein
MNPQPGCLPFSLGLVFILLCCSIIGCSNQTNEPATDDNSSASKSYSLDYCVVSGNDLNDEDTDMIPFTYEYDGIQIVFCCKPCLPKFKKDPEKYMAIIKEEMEDLANEPSS